MNIIPKRKGDHISRSPQSKEHEKPWSQPSLFEMSPWAFHCIAISIRNCLQRSRIVECIWNLFTIENKHVGPTVVWISEVVSTRTRKSIRRNTLVLFYQYWIIVNYEHKISASNTIELGKEANDRKKEKPGRMQHGCPNSKEKQIRQKDNHQGPWLQEPCFSSLRVASQSSRLYCISFDCLGHVSFCCRAWSTLFLFVIHSSTISQSNGLKCFKQKSES